MFFKIGVLEHLRWLLLQREILSITIELNSRIIAQIQEDNYLRDIFKYIWKLLCNINTL